MTPPQEHWQAPWEKEWSLIQTIPDSSTRAIRSPRARSARPDRGAEAELGVVGEVDRLLLGVDDDDRQDRAEDLLAHDPHLVGDVR